MAGSVFGGGGEDVAEKVLPTVRKDGVESVFENYFGKCEGFLLSDLSIQLSFDYTPIRALVNPVLPEPHWALREGQFAEDGGGCFVPFGKRRRRVHTREGWMGVL